LYPILLPDRTEIVVGFQDGLQQFIVPVGSAAMNAEIRDFRFLLEKRSTFQYLKPAKHLYSWLIKPLLSELQRHQVKTLVIVPEGALRTMPFAALYDGKHYVVEQFALATTPGLSLTDPKAMPNEKLHVLLNGLTESVQGFVGLPNVTAEINAIQSEFKDATILENKTFLLTSVGDILEKDPYQIIHIASHGQFDRDPKKTFLLTYDGRMTMDILEQYLTASQYRNKPIELLTLSACQTAAGDDRAALGMAGVAIKAGARSALASLWFINDQSSSQLVIKFYAELKQKLSKAEALQQAQIMLLKDSNSRYRHASYWGAFLLIGNWL
jgi:CHAT domain-containing protein